MCRKWSNDKCQCECWKPIKYCVCEEDYAWSNSIFAGECEKNCEIGEYLRDFTCTKSLVDNLGVACEEIVVTPENAFINFINKGNYWLTGFMLLIRGGSILHIWIWQSFVAQSSIF